MARLHRALDWTPDIRRDAAADALVTDVPRRAAIDIVFGDRRLVYAGLACRIRRLAHGLPILGVGKGDRIVWTGANHAACLETLVAAAKLGAVLVPIDHRLDQHAIQRLLDELGARAVRSTDRTRKDLIASHSDAPIGDRSIRRIRA